MVVSGSRIEGGTQIISASVRKTIQSIKEIVGNHSDADIYVVLKETNMEPNETAQKLLNQDPFHEVKRKRDKKKENTGYRGSTETRKPMEQTRQGPKPQTSWDQNARRGGFTRNTSSRGVGVSQEFRVVRDNRSNQNSDGDKKPALLQCSTSVTEQGVSNVPVKSSLGILTDQKHSDARKSEQHLSSQGPNSVHDSGPGHARNVNPNSACRKALLEEPRSNTPISTSQVQGQKLHSSRPHTATSSTSSVVGLYSSSTDPVHVPSPDSRLSGAVGAIKREVGVVGVRRQASQDSVTRSSIPTSSFSTFSVKETSASTESFGHSPAIAKIDEFGQTSVAQPVMPGMSVGRPFLGNQYNSKQHQQPVGHQKVSQPNMEWKPKSSQKSSPFGPGIIGTTSKPTSSPANNSTISTDALAHLPEKLSQVSISKDQHVIIPQHLRVPEADRSQLTFGSFEAGFDSTKDFIFGIQAVEHAEESKDEPAVSISLSVPVTSSEVSGGDEMELLEDQGRISGSDSPASDAASGNPLPEKNESSSPQNLDSCRSVGLGQSPSPPYTPEEPQQQPDPPILSSFSAYDPQAGYDEPFFRSSMDENLRGQGLASSQEALSSHVTNSAPPSTVAMLQQPVAQLYPQVHISHFPNFMPYRQFLSPVYVPPMAVPNYSSNPAYPHPSNGSSYLLMQGGSSHLTSGNLKYAASQYKPVPAGGPAGYGNYTNPAGYTINTPGTVGNAAGLEDARVKYKDGNLYVPNPQAETSEIWIQTPRELPSLQSTPYYNLSGQTPAYVPSHTGHSSFNAPTQSTHMPFPGLYHPPQPTAIANPHHLVHQQLPGMGGNVGVGVAAPGPQVGAYQQPQLGHLNWTANF